MGSDLKPCPFCGNADLRITPNGIGDFYVICDTDFEGEMSCGASSSDRSCETEEGAAQRWNSRAEGVAALQQAGDLFAEIAKKSPEPAAEPVAWRPIETAPKDGSIIDVWRPEGGRDTVFWGFPSHECGEMGQYCDSEWHSIRAPGWVCSTFNQLVGRKHAPFTHWMPLPSAPLPQQTALVEGQD